MTESNQPHEKRCETCDNWQFHRLNECEFIQARVSSDRKEFLEMVGCASHAASTSDNEQKEPQQELSIRSNKEIESLERSLEFYKKRAEMLQCWQSSMRDPERKIVCDILANGFTR